MLLHLAQCTFQILLNKLSLHVDLKGTTSGG
jgi:hypothetical protein